MDRTVNLECPKCGSLFEASDIFFDTNKGYVCCPHCNRASQYYHPNQVNNDHEDDGN